METSALTFAQPAWFLALLLVAALGGLYFWSQRRNDSLIAKIVSPRLKEELAGAVSIGRRAWKAALVLSALALIVVALARPQMGFVEREVKQKGRDVIIAVDTSRSMLATDVNPTRLSRAKLLAQDLMRLMRGDRVGLIAFAGSSFLQAPLTLDQGAVLGSLDELDTTIIPKGGTNIAAAIRQAQEAFGKGEGQTRALIILTDGEELDADGIAAARNAAADGIRIFTVGIGSGEGSLIPIRGEGGGSDFVRDESGKPVQSRLDETRLREIATAGGGFYEKLGPDTARTIFEKGILPMEESERGMMTSRQPVEKYYWPLGAALVLLGLWSLLGEKRRTPVRGAAAVAALILFAGLPSVQAEEGAGLKDYEAGNYGKALEDFSRGLEKTPASERLQYNAGTAAYKLEDYGKAVDYFTKALLTDDRKLREDASYNLGNSLTRRGEKAQGNDAKKSDWKNAIQHYTEALNIDPKNKNAEENREIVKKLLEDLEKKEKEEQEKQDQQQDQNQDQKDQDQKDQNKDQQQNQDQQNKDQQKQDQNDQQKKDDKNDQSQQNKDQQGNQGGNDQKDQKPQDQKDQSGQGGDQKDEQEKKDQEKKDQQSGNQQDQQKDQQKQDQQPGSGGDQKDQQQQASNQQGEQPQPTPGEKKEGDLKTGGEENQEQQPEQGGQEASGSAGEQEQDGQMSAAQARSLLNSLRGDEERVKLMRTPETENTLKDW